MLFITLRKLLRVARTLVMLLSLDWRYGYKLCRSIDFDMNIGPSRYTILIFDYGYWAGSLLLTDAALPWILGNLERSVYNLGCRQVIQDIFFVLVLRSML